MRSISACDAKIAVIERFYYYKIIMIKQHSQFNKPKYNEPLTKRVNTPSGIYLFLIVSSLLFFGGLMVFSASITLGQHFDMPSFLGSAVGPRRLQMIIPAMIGLFLFSQINYNRYLNAQSFWKSPAAIGSIVVVFLLVMVLIPSVSGGGDSSRWFKLGRINLQPSELAKVVVVLFIAALCVARGDQVKSFTKGFLPAIGFLGLLTVLIASADFGTAALIGFVGCLVMIVAGIRWYYFISLVVPCAIGFWFFVMSVPYRWLRVLSYLHPEKEGAMATDEIPQAILNAKYQVSQSLITIGSGGLWGKGLGQGVMKLEFLPEDTTDFIFAVIGEELGLMGVFFVVLFYLALMFCVMKIVLKTDNRFGKLVAFGLGLIIVTQAAMNMLVVTGLAPVTGISLPFISHGGSGLVVLAVAAGIIINIAKEDITIMHLKEAT